MKKRTVPLLSYCEYVSRDANDSIQASRARLHLFESLIGVYPKMLRDLSHEVFPSFQKLADDERLIWGMYGPPGVSPYELITQIGSANSGGYKADTPKSMKQRSELQLRIDNWALTFNVSERWAKDEAIRTLGHWHRNRDARASLKWNPFYGHSTSRPSTGDTFSFSYPGWETELFTWVRYRELISNNFVEKLAEYEKVTRDRAESCGLVRSQRKYSHVNFEWFVLYQFASWSSTKIADQYSSKRGVDESTVLKGIKTAARLIGWNQLRRPSRKIR